MEPDETKPPAPEISAFIEVGLNSITRKLEDASQISTPETQSNEKEADSSKDKEVSLEQGDSHIKESDAEKATVTTTNHKLMPFAAVFVLRPSQPTVLHAHLPQLISTSTLAIPGLPAPRLIQLPSGCGARLCESLGLARVSFIGLREGAPNSTQLVDLIRRVVPEVKIPWIEETKNAAYLPVKINITKTSIGKHKGAASKSNKKASGGNKTEAVSS
jgi:ribonuclease P/MRP protein subunit POP3